MLLCSELLFLEFCVKLYLLFFSAHKKVDVMLYILCITVDQQIKYITCGESGAPEPNYKETNAKWLVLQTLSGLRLK